MNPFMIACQTPLQCTLTFNPAAESTNVYPLAGPPKSVLAAALKRCERAGLRLVITAPADVRAFSRGVTRFPERLIESGTHARYNRAYRTFCRTSEAPHDRGSWRVMVVDSRSRVIGAITARFFCGEIDRTYLHAPSLLAGYTPVFRNECELAVNETFSRAQRYSRTPAEISHWSVPEGPHARLVGVALLRAMLALAVAFDLPLAIAAADHQHGELARFMRWTMTPLGRQGKFHLPPFVQRATGARLRLLVIDTAALGGRLRRAAIDLGVLREHCPIVSIQ
jgi:hypothetical protein